MASPTMTTETFKIEQIYTGCLAQGAYFIESNGESMVIDPLRETEPYLSRIKSSRTKLKYIFETHFHADFVSGHVDLSKATDNTPIVFGPTADPGFKATIAKDGEVFKLGAITITVLHTPGHTMESSCFLLKDEEGTPKAIFTGDTLFIGDVGRPDLAQKGTGLTQEQLATHLFNSLRDKVMTLPDDVVVYPAHGAGSACGKNMSSETSDKLGNQKMTNYALRADMTVKEFVQELTANLPPPPTYFGAAVARNKSADGDSYDTLLEKGQKKLTPDDVEALMSKTINGKLPYIIDTRWHSFYAEGHIPGAIYAGIEGPFGPFIASAIGDVTRPYIAVCYEDAAMLKEVITRLSRFGFDHPLGYLDGGFEAWKKAGKPVEDTKCMFPDDLADHMTAHPDAQLIDCRKPGEHVAKHHPKAKLLTLEAQNIAKADTSKPILVHCGSGYRSHIYISLLRFHNPDLKHSITNVNGGMMEMEKSEKLKPQLFLGETPCQIAAKKKAEEEKKAKKKAKNISASADNHIRVIASRSKEMYLTYAIDVLNGTNGHTKHDSVILTGMGNAMQGVVQLAEALKRSVKGLHQLTELDTETVTDKKPEGDKERRVPTIKLTLATTGLDKNHSGYQAPIPESEVKEEGAEVKLMKTERRERQTKKKAERKKTEEPKKKAPTTRDGKKKATSQADGRRRRDGRGRGRDADSKNADTKKPGQKDTKESRSSDRNSTSARRGGQRDSRDDRAPMRGGRKTEGGSRTATAGGRGGRGGSYSEGRREGGRGSGRSDRGRRN